MNPVKIPDRRQAPRRRSLDEHGIISVRVRPGHDVGLIDISATGALVESSQQLRPGASVEILLVTEDRRTSLRGHVLRCAVVRLQASGVRYRGAIGFNGQLSWFADAGEAGYLRPSDQVWPF